MSHLYYHIKGRGKGPPTVRHFNNKKNHQIGPHN